MSVSARGPQPFLAGQRTGSPLREAVDDSRRRPFSARPTDLNVRKGMLHWEEQDCEQQRHHLQKFIISLNREHELGDEKSLREGARERREWVRATAAQTEREQRERMKLLVEQRRSRPLSAGWARARQGPKDAKEVSPRAITGRVAPIVEAIKAARAEVARQERVQSKELAAVVQERANGVAAEQRDRQSKSDELGTQCDNLTHRRDLMAAQKSNLDKGDDSHRRAQVRKHARHLCTRACTERARDVGSFCTRSRRACALRAALDGGPCASCVCAPGLRARQGDGQGGDPAPAD
jgi:hypothetical protein